MIFKGGMIRKIVVLLCISVSCGAQIGAKAQQQRAIHGLWQNSQFGYQMTLMLNPDGSGEFDGEPIKYSTAGDRLSLELGGSTTVYIFSLQGNSLVLSGGDLQGKVTFTRNGSAPVSADPVTPAYSNTDGNLTGLWSGNGETIEFRLDGKCIYLGNTFPYQVSQGHVILTSGQGNVTFAYVVRGTQLTLTANGQNIVYNKAGGAGNGAPPPNTGGVAMELVGEWCYMNMNTNSQTSRCINLHADGTYVYSSESSRSVSTDTFSGGTASQGSDQGTWYVQGDRIYYNSQTQGQGSYRLEKRNHPRNTGDPMIVLDGESYVTATLRAPWK